MDAFTACPQCGAVGPSRQQCQCGYPAAGPGFGERAARRLTKLVSGRVRIVAIAAGAALCWYGVQEFRLSSNATVDPVLVDLAKLEAGESAPQNHLRLGPHLALYGNAVYSISDKDKNIANPPVQYAIYAVVSESNPYGKLMKQLEQPQGDDKEPVVINATSPEWVAMLVKTRRFRNAGDIPQQALAHPGLQGMAINQIQTLSDQEAELVRQVVPGINLDKVVILEEGRRPKSHLESLGIATGAACCALLGLASFCLERVFAKRDAQAAAAAAKAAIATAPATKG